MKRCVMGVFILFLIIQSMLPLFAQPASKISIAIMDFQNTSGKHDLDYLQNAIPEMLITNLAKSGHLNIVERGRLQDAIKEMELGMSGVVDQGRAAELGKAVGADAILVGSYLEISHLIRINARLIDVQTSKVLKAESVQGRTGKEIFSLMDQLAHSIESQLLGEKKKKAAPQITSPSQPKPRKREVVQKPAPAKKSAENPPQLTAKKGGHTMLYILGGAALIGGGVAAAMLLGKKSDNTPAPPANADVTITVKIPQY